MMRPDAFVLLSTVFLRPVVAARALIFHKPCGLITTHHDQLGRKTVYDALHELLPDLAKQDTTWHACGRLDQDTSGLLIITTDGQLVRHVTDPTVGAGLTKRYRVRCHLLADGALDQLRAGVELGGGLGTSSPAEVHVEAVQRKSHILSIGIREGKNRQIRRMLHAVGSGVMALERRSIGSLELGDLEVGGVRWLSDNELQELLGYQPPTGPAEGGSGQQRKRPPPPPSTAAAVPMENTPPQMDAAARSLVTTAAPAQGSYRLLDCGDLQRLERFGAHTVRRPCPAATWPAGLPADRWDALADLAYVEASQAGGTAGQGSGRWEGSAAEALCAEGSDGLERDDGGAVPGRWTLASDAGFELALSPGPSGQLGAFPEQQANWRWLRSACAAASASGTSGTRGTSDASSAQDPLRVLNLFAHTGGSTLACAAASAPAEGSRPSHTRPIEVVHLDGARSAVGRARSNADLSNLSGVNIRWISEDVLTYCRRAVKRGERFDGIIADPPAFGRGGKKGAEWKIQRDMPVLVDLLTELLAEAPAFVLLTCHDHRWQSARLGETLQGMLPEGEAAAPPGQLEEGVMVLQAEERGGRDLPMGHFARWRQWPAPDTP